jgi:hypothetical protein
MEARTCGSPAVRLVIIVEYWQSPVRMIQSLACRVAVPSLSRNVITHFDARSFRAVGTVESLVNPHGCQMQNGVQERLHER